MKNPYETKRPHKAKKAKPLVHDDPPKPLQTEKITQSMSRRGDSGKREENRRLAEAKHIESVLSRKVPEQYVPKGKDIKIKFHYQNIKVVGKETYYKATYGSQTKWINSETYEHYIRETKMSEPAKWQKMFWGTATGIDRRAVIFKNNLKRALLFTWPINDMALLAKLEEQINSMSLKDLSLWAEENKEIVQVAFRPSDEAFRSEYMHRSEKETNADIKTIIKSMKGYVR